MSERAIVWAQGQVTRTSTEKFCLMRLCAYLDAEGHGWAKVEGPKGLALEMQTTPRTVYRCLRALEKQGLIRRTGKFKYRAMPFYQADLDGDAAAVRTLTRMSGLNPDMDVRVEAANPDMGVTLNPDMGVRPKHRNPSSVEDKSSPSERVGAGVAEGQGEGQEDGFAAFWAAMPEASKRGVSSERLSAPAYAEEVADGADPAALLAAAQAYAADRSLWGASGKPKAAHNFLKSGVWKDLKPAVGKGAAAAWAGPAEIRAAFVGRFGEAFTRSWLDPCAWVEDGRRIVTRTMTAAAKLQSECRGLLADLNATADVAR